METQAYTPWYPMSDSRIDVSKKRQPSKSRPRPRPKPKLRLSRRNSVAPTVRKPLHAVGNSNEKRVLVWTAAGATSKCISVPIDGNPGRRNNRAASSPPAVYSYSIVNQRLSHIAAFVPPRTSNGSSSPQIAYRFVFTNSL